MHYSIQNTNRVTGTIVGSEISKLYGEEGLPDNTINLHFTGSAGQSFGAFIPKGMSLYLTGDANDYIGKGLSGGRIVAKIPADNSIVANENVIIGNVAFYGATSGEAFINGKAGERFAVRNSGASVVVEGIGDHGLEYMTGGEVVILGEVGKNFAAGMSGGVAYVLPKDAEQFKAMCNKEMIIFEQLEERAEIERIKELIEKHIELTGSLAGQQVLVNWDKFVQRFVKVIPKDYKRMIANIQKGLENGLSEEDAAMEAFANNSNQDKKTSK